MESVDQGLAPYAEAIRNVIRGHHPRCYQVRPEGIPDDLPRDLCDCRILWMLTAGAEHERAEDAQWALCACGHTRSSHTADGECVGCAGPDCR